MDFFSPGHLVVIAVLAVGLGTIAGYLLYEPIEPAQPVGALP